MNALRQILDAMLYTLIAGLVLAASLTAGMFLVLWVTSFVPGLQ